jgi:hypothetical protein
MTTANPWPIGARVRLANPENPKHPRAGRTGTVIRSRYFEPVIRYVKGEYVTKAPGLWLVSVRFRPEGDGFDLQWRWGPLPTEFLCFGESLTLESNQPPKGAVP